MSQWLTGKKNSRLDGFLMKALKSMKTSELFVNLAAINMISKAKTHHV
jgi:hypothetical protein